MTFIVEQDSPQSRSVDSVTQKKKTTLGPFFLFNLAGQGLKAVKGFIANVPETTIAGASSGGRAFLSLLISNEKKALGKLASQGLSWTAKKLNIKNGYGNQRILDIFNTTISAITNSPEIWLLFAGAAIPFSAVSGAASVGIYSMIICGLFALETAQRRFRKQLPLQKNLQGLLKKDLSKLGNTQNIAQRRKTAATLIHLANIKRRNEKAITLSKTASHVIVGAFALFFARAGLEFFDGIEQATFMGKAFGVTSGIAFGLGAYFGMKKGRSFGEEAKQMQVILKKNNTSITKKQAATTIYLDTRQASLVKRFLSLTQPTPQPAA